MRYLLLTSTLWFAFFSFGQNWQTILMSDVSSEPFLYWNKGNFPNTKHDRHFRINPYDQSFWGFSDEHVLRMDYQGNFQLWDQNNCFFAIPPNEYTDLAFTPQNTYVVSTYTGVYQWDGSNWGTVYNQNNVITLNSDADTMWMARLSNAHLQNINGTITTGSYGGRRIESRNGFTLVSNSVIYNGLGLVNTSGVSTYLTSTSPYYLDTKNYDFKYTSYGDTLFTSGDRGFSIAVDGIFIDTITKYNTFNMPEMPILEFEFTTDNNIWAVFGTGDNNQVPEKIAFLDRNTNIWSNGYDENNSPIVFSWMSIEVDSNNNLWVANGGYLHVLKVGVVPQWLGESELKNNEHTIQVFPNPNNGNFNIVTNKNYTNLNVFDLTGRLVYQSSSIVPGKIDLDLAPGAYQLKFSITDNPESIVTKKIVVQ